VILEIPEIHQALERLAIQQNQDNQMVESKE